MRLKQTDETQSPVVPQFQMGATSDQAKLEAELQQNALPGPGAIVDRLGQQFQYPRADIDSQVGERHGNGGNNLGEIG